MKIFTIAKNEKNNTTRFTLNAHFAIGSLGCLFSGFAATIMPVYLQAMVNDIQGSQATGNLEAIGFWTNVLFILGWLAGAFFLEKDQPSFRAKKRLVTGYV